MAVEITAPDEFQGTVVGHISKRKGILTATEGVEGWFTVQAQVNYLLIYFNIFQIYIK